MCKTTKSAENCTFHAGCAVRIQYYLSLGKGEEGKRSVQAMYFTSLAFDSPSHCNEPAPINFIISSPLTLVRQIEVSHRVIGGKCVTIIHLIIVVPPTFQVFLGRKEGGRLYLGRNLPPFVRACVMVDPVFKAALAATDPAPPSFLSPERAAHNLLIWL